MCWEELDRGKTWENAVLNFLCSLNVYAPKAAVETFLLKAKLWGMMYYAMNKPDAAWWISEQL